MIDLYVIIVLAFVLSVNGSKNNENGFEGNFSTVPSEVGFVPVNFEQDDEYGDVTEDESELLEMFYDVLQNSQAIEILFEAVEDAFDERKLVMSIPKEIDPSTRTILVEDAEDTLILYIKNQEQDLLETKFRFDILLNNSDTNEEKQTMWQKYAKVLDAIADRYEDIMEYLREDQDYAYEYEDDEEEAREDTVTHYLENDDPLSATTATEIQTESVAHGKQHIYLYLILISLAFVSVVFVIAITGAHMRRKTYDKIFVEV